MEELIEDREQVEHLLRMHRLLTHDPVALCPRCVELVKRRRMIKFRLFPLLYGADPERPLSRA